MSELLSNERQVAPTVDGIRRDHVARYEWAARQLGSDAVVLDAACGVGYGSRVLADAGLTVRGMDRSVEAIAYANEHYNHVPGVKFDVGNLYGIEPVPDAFDAVVCFEALEHIAKPEVALRSFREVAGRLLVSVPNEESFPYRGQYLHHIRHYRHQELTALLAATGWRVVEYWGQAGPESVPEQGMNGRTLIAVAERVDVDAVPEPADPMAAHLLNGKVPETVAIVAMGESGRTFMASAANKGGKLVDEVWAINSMGGVIQHDRLFHMDDMRIQQARADSSDGSIAGMMKWLPDNAAPVYTSKVYPEYPSAVEYPLEWVLNKTRHCYFNNTVPYALAFAIALGVKHVHLYGCDYSYAHDPHRREKGRACLEYWLGVAGTHGIAVTVPNDTSLLDANEKLGRDTLYGYDAEWMTVEMTESGFNVGRVDRRPEDIPTADQMAIRYSHNPAIENREHEVKT